MVNRESVGGEPRGLYPMRVVEQLTGLTRRQIRYYEDQGLLAPDRSQGGHRLYAPEEVNLLLLIKSLMAKGFSTIEAVKRCLNSDLRLSPTSRSAESSQSSGRMDARFLAAPAKENDAENYFARHRRWPK